MYQAADQQRWVTLSKEYLAKAPTHSQESYQNLMGLLTFHEWRYYVQNDPLVSDYEYDLLYKQLEAIEMAHPIWIQSNSPTQRIGSDLTENLPTVPHLTPMLSLDNSYNAEDLYEFDKQVRKFGAIDTEEAIEYVVEPKFDGGTIALVYENDQLLRGATRGNGTMGEEMTANAKTIRSIPLSANFLKHGIAKVELRGEVLIRKDVFERVNAEREANGQPLFANPRNAATGGLRMKDPKETAQRSMEAFIYQLGYAEDLEGNNALDRLPFHKDSLDMLQSLGFKVPQKESKVCKNIEEVIAFCKGWEDKRADYAYEIDGMVVKVNNRALQEKTGSTSHHPRWAIAYKFKAKQATSKLLNIEYQVGKIGSITPVAKIEPVFLAGVTVSSVSLHNEDFIQAKDIRIGDTLLVERAGDVIPYIVKSLEELRNGKEVPVEYPTHCPINTTDTPIELIREEGESAWRCPNCVCGAQELQKMIFHVSKDAMDIDGFGKSIVERFFQLGWLNTLADIYRLNYENIGQLEGFKAKSVANLQAAIEKAKKNPVYRLLHSLSIHHLGKKASKLLAAEIDHVLELRNWELEQFLAIKDIGPVVAANIQAWFSVPSNVTMLQEMEALGVNLTATLEDKPRKVAADAPLAGKTILFTGTLNLMGRKEAQDLAEAAGAKSISAVSGNLNILVVGDNAGSKLTKAQSLGTVTIWTEEEFLAQIKGEV